MSNASRRGPRPLSEIVGELFTVRGYGRLHARQELEDAWNKAVGEPYRHQTCLGEVRRGVLNVTVAHSTLLAELAAFRKPALLAALRSGAPATTIRDIQFRVGAIVLEAKPTVVTASNPLAVHRDPDGLRSPAQLRCARAGGRSNLGRGSGPKSGQP
jgi:hypothetical protein